MLQKLTSSKKAKIVAIIIIGAIIATLVPIASQAGGSESNDISERVNFTGVDILIYSYNKTWNHDWHTYMKDGVKQDLTGTVANNDNGTLKGGRTVAIKPYWEITDMEGVNANDYFEVDLPDGFLSYKDVGVVQDVYTVADPTKSVGTVKLVKEDNNYKFVVTLNKYGAESTSLTETWLRGQATLTNKQDENTSVVYGDITSDLELLAPAASNSKLWERTESGKSPITKMGWTQNSTSKDGITKRYAYWRVEVTGDNYTDTLNAASKGQTVSQSRNSIIVEDYIDDYLVFDKNNPVSFSFWYCYIRGEDGRASSETFTSKSINDQFTRVEFSDEQMEKMTPEEFKNAIAGEDPLSYGIYQDKYFVLNLGTMPNNNLKMPISLESALSALKSNYDNTRGPNGNKTANEDDLAATTNAWTNMYGNSDNIPGFYIQFKTEFIGQNGWIYNDINMNWDGGEKTKTGKVNFPEFAGSVNRGLPGSVTVTKKDGETEEPMDGVSFKLQKLNKSTDEFSDYTARGGETVKSTSGGSVVFEGLTWGTYRVVEENALEGYTTDAIFEDENEDLVENGEFKITGSETGTYNITAFNYKEDTDPEIINIRQNPDPEPEGILGGPSESFPAMNNSDAIVASGIDADEGVTLGELISDEQIPSASIGETEVPLHNGGLFASWALLNLILAIGGVLVALFAGIKTFLSRNKEDDREQPEDKKSRLQWIVSTIVFAVGGILLYVLTQDTSATMVVVDNWTIFNALFLGVTAISTFFVVKGSNEVNEDSTVNP